jgi:hypothetical protein
MSDDDSTTEQSSVSAADLARFHRNAPAALERRGGGSVAEALASSCELVVMGCAPIAGLLWFDWSPAQLLVFLLVGAWVGIVCDVARVALAGRGVQAFGQAFYDDVHVWEVVAALRFGRTIPPPGQRPGRNEAWGGVLADLAGGGLATAVIVGMLGLTGVQGEAGGPLTERSLVASVACLAAWQVGSAAWEIVRHWRIGAAAGPVKAHSGARGMGLFVLMFIMLMAGDPLTRGGIVARRMMLVVNGAIVVVGVLSAAAIVWLRQETEWLREYLRRQPTESPAQAPSPTTRKKRKRQ